MAGSSDDSQHAESSGSACEGVEPLLPCGGHDIARSPKTMPEKRRRHTAPPTATPQGTSRGQTPAVEDVPRGIFIPDCRIILSALAHENRAAECETAMLLRIDLQDSAEYRPSRHDMGARGAPRRRALVDDVAR